jgi:hypothetical protein
MTIVFLLSAGLSLISHAGEANVKPQKEKAEAVVKPQSEKKATLKVVASSDKAASLEMINSVPVRGVQFILSGANITEVRTTKRTAGFLAKFNEKNGAVILVSTSDDRIAPGKGSIGEIICDKPGSAQLSGIRIAGSNREPL